MECDVIGCGCGCGIWGRGGWRGRAVVFIFFVFFIFYDLIGWRVMWLCWDYLQDAIFLLV